MIRMAEQKSFSIKEELRKCIARLGTVKGSPDQLEEVLIPVREVMDIMRAMCQAIWEPGDPEDRKPEIKIEEKEAIPDEHLKTRERNGLQMEAGKAE